MAPKKTKEKSKHADASPAKSLGKELTALQRNLHRISQAYEKRLKADIASVTAWNSSMEKLDKPSREQLRDLGDMIGLLRKLKIKPEKGRRRDLRKVEAVVEDLVSLSRPERVA